MSNEYEKEVWISFDYVRMEAALKQGWPLPTSKAAEEIFQSLILSAMNS